MLTLTRNEYLVLCALPTAADMPLKTDSIRMLVPNIRGVGRALRGLMESGLATAYRTRTGRITKWSISAKGISDLEAGTVTHKGKARDAYLDRCERWSAMSRDRGLDYLTRCLYDLAVDKDATLKDFAKYMGVPQRGLIWQEFKAAVKLLWTERGTIRMRILPGEDKLKLRLEAKGLQQAAAYAA